MSMDRTNTFTRLETEYTLKKKGIWKTLEPKKKRKWVSLNQRPTSWTWLAFYVLRKDDDMFIHISSTTLIIVRLTFANIYREATPLGQNPHFLKEIFTQKQFYARFFPTKCLETHWWKSLEEDSVFTTHFVIVFVFSIRRLYCLHSPCVK